jgi:hypothetical protein
LFTWAALVPFFFPFLNMLLSFCLITMFLECYSLLGCSCIAAVGGSVD